ncbi:MAG: 4-(cytidine 5'-diphospho)-2-C-methyl-D-erythritol kinase, partial [Proteobacteria bacterium]
MPSDFLEVLSPAKLNLFLHVTGRQANGYHELQTVFQLLNWGDTLRFELSETPGIHLTSDLSGVNPTDNLIIRAANLLSLPSDAGVSVTVDKVIPMGGGLGGGSSNAAVTMLALNKLLALGYSVDEMANMGAALGADVPVFVRGQSA